ncbi:TonB family protein [Marinobacter sp. TBZ242]|uniref:TonB family protein n=1 Tax=Marinobacter azerbaijanicus TaxID=3050455 RepID=A0ABT7I8W2_9GAMM|nr:energy transducer TonB [Marinobacter sp. TBZ242]MDL0430581.1 TonB family protein [Marinobacter sp. TBZ242]
MLEYGSVTSLPGKYRITLAISIALLLHTLVMSVLPFTFPEKETRHRTVQVELLSPGSQPSSEVTTSTRRQTPESDRSQIAEESSDPDLQPALRSETQSQNSSRDGRTEPRDPSQPASLERSSEQSSAQPTQTQTATSAASGNPDATTEDQPEPITQISRQPQQTNPYLTSLAARVARELDKRPVPSSRRVRKPVTMELELRIMDSGALTSARVTRSTGFREIDQAVYQAALLASPYPEPPEENSEKGRFRVELIFTPERL